MVDVNQRRRPKAMAVADDRIVPLQAPYHIACPQHEPTIGKSGSSPRHARWYYTAVVGRRSFAFPVVGLVLLALTVVVGSAAESDLYQLLGVTRKATAKEIKQAYRRKALDTHPDKNRDVPPERAAEAFRQVVHAFEILSDDVSRKRYDRTGRSDDNGSRHDRPPHQQQQQQQQYQWNWYGSNYRPVKLKDQFEAQQAQSRVLHVVSLAQLQTIMLDDDDLLERNLLLCFTTHPSAAQADDEIVFPFPFAGMSSQGIWWEDMLQTVRIHFYRSSELSKFFGVTATETNTAPVFVFAKRGSSLTEATAPELPRIHTNDRQTFETWVWDQIQVEVVFVNEHDHPVEIYWVHGTRAHLKLLLPPGEASTHTSMLSHEWYIRDARVDTHQGAIGRYKLTNESSLGSWKIVNDTSPQRHRIRGGQCFDLSGHCAFWNNHEGACRTNPNFMWQVCQRTCGKCPAVGQQEHDEF